MYPHVPQISSSIGYTALAIASVWELNKYNIVRSAPWFETKRRMENGEWRIAKMVFMLFVGFSVGSVGHSPMWISHVNHVECSAYAVQLTLYVWQQRSRNYFAFIQQCQQLHPGPDVHIAAEWWVHTARTRLHGYTATHMHHAHSHYRRNLCVLDR